MSDENPNDIVLRTGNGKKEIARLTIPGSLGRVVAVQMNFLPGDNTKLTDLTVQLTGNRMDDDDVTVVESHGIIGFAPNPGVSDEDDDYDDPDDE